MISGSLCFNALAHVQIPTCMDYWSMNSEVQTFAPFIQAEIEIEIYEEVVYFWLKCYAALIVDRQTEIVCEPIIRSSVCNLTAGYVYAINIITTVIQA